MARATMVGVAVLLLVCAAMAHAASPLMQASFIDAQDSRTYTVWQPESEVPPGVVAASAASSSVRAARMQMQMQMMTAEGVLAKQLWTESQQYAVYTTGGVSDHPRNGSASLPSTFALGTWLNPPCEAYSLDETGKHIFDFQASSPDAQFDIATARHINTYPAGDVDVAVAEFSGFSAPYSCSVFGFASTGSRAGSTPVWRYDIPSCQASMLDNDVQSIVMSDDGSTVAFAVASNRSTTGGSDFTVASPQLYVFDGQTGKLLFVYDLRSQGATFMPGGVSITRHGEWIAFSNGVFTYVVDRATGKLRGNGPPVNKGAAVACHICPMGTFITWGSHEAHISKWNATSATYVDRFVIPIQDGDGPWYVMNSVTSINGGGGDPDGCLVAFSYIDQNARRVRVEVFNMFTAKKYWTWTSPQDVSVQTEAYLSFHQGYLGVAHWGNDDATAPQTLLFGLKSNSSLFSFTSTGSMFDIQIAVQDAPIPSWLDGHVDYSTAVAPAPAVTAPGMGKNVFVVVAGKHVHASQMGNGGDAYAFLVTL